MRNLIITTAALFLAAAAFAQGGKLEYPETLKRDSSAKYFGTLVQDPYKWLEDDMSEETKDWVIRQNTFTFGYLEKITFREKLKDRLTKLWNYEKVGAPFKENGVTYFYKNDGLQNQYVLYSQDDNGVEKVFLDPNKFREDGTISLGQVSFSKDGKIVAYAISEGGSDWRKIIIMDAASGEILEDTIRDVKFSGISWKGSEGFYYSSYDKPKGSVLSAKTDQHKLYYHKLGTPQSSDKVIFGEKEEEKRRYVSGYTTEDDRYLIISASVSTSGNELYFIDLESKTRSAGLTPFITGYESDTYVLENEDDKFYLVTNLDAPNKRLVSCSAEFPDQNNWRNVIPETEFVLNASTGGGYFFASYMKDAISQVKQYQYSGELVREIQLPGVGTASGFGAKKEEKTLYYSFTNY